jgi:hypothetical protein
VRQLQVLYHKHLTFKPSFSQNNPLPGKVLQHFIVLKEGRCKAIRRQKWKNGKMHLQSAYALTVAVTSLNYDFLYIPWRFYTSNPSKWVFLRRTAGIS